MATIDLGKIKQVWRGTWNNSPNPAYSVDDLVEYTDTGVTSTYIAVSTPGSQVPSSGGSVQSNWNLVAKGVADPIPTQSSSTNGKALVSDGTNASWGDGGAWTKIASGTGPSSDVTGISLSSIFSDTYKFYKIFVSWRQDDWMKVRFIRSSDNGTQTYGGYRWVMSHPYENADGGPDRQGGSTESYIPLQFWNGTDNGFSINVMTAWNPYSSSTITGFQTDCDFSDGSQLHSQRGSGYYDAHESHSGLTLFGHNGDSINSTNFSYLVLGAKE